MIGPDRAPIGERPALVERLVRALILDSKLYEEVAYDRTALSQAIGVVILAGVVSGLRLSKLLDTLGPVVGVVVSLSGWIMLTAIVHFIGTVLFRTRARSFRAVATCLGFADMPAVVNLLGSIPIVGAAIRIVVWFWLLAAVIVATRAAFGVSWTRGALIGGLGFASYLLLGLVVGVWAS